ncbi:YqaE/Pmp3 family membrane protein [Tunicatimonas pelagia]|nr:YqaE/Pmp3 family membrane protein [Tunicatimonas pelagia]WKN44361.1 YqaE/Pmp3 family membrane protein [Tunicatimonas pelagia]
MSLLMIILAILLPPLAVGLQKGLSGSFWLNVLLTIVGWVPGVIHAFFTLK